MSVYVIVSYDIEDPEGYQEYVQSVTPLLQRHGGEVLVADFNAKALEGKARDVHILLRFPSKQAATAWYEDPDYRPVKKIRLDACDKQNLVLASEFDLPED